MPIWTDPEFLLRHQYGTPENLRARMALHERFGTGAVNWFRWIYDLIPSDPSDGGLEVLEVGCGPGRLWGENLDRLPSDWALTLTDLSPGMVEEAQGALATWPGRADCLVADAQKLPFPNATFEVAIANHMLYHLPSLDDGITELGRVLRPGGRLIAATNGDDHMRELNDLLRRAFPSDVAAAIGLQPQALAFRLETGSEALAPTFASVERFDQRSDLVVTEVEPVMAYVASMTRTHAAAQLLGENRIAMGLREVARIVGEAIDRRGAFRISRSSGVFVAHKHDQDNGGSVRG